MSSLARMAVGLLLLVHTQAAEDGRVSGVVRDPSGAVVPGCQVSLRRAEASAEAREARTDARGRYTIAGLAPGRYAATAASDGFEPRTLPNLQIAAGRDTVADFTLRIARQSTAVLVTERVTAGGADNARTSDTASLLGAMPGVSLYTSGGVSSIPAIHGMNGDRVNVTVNGMSIAPACGNHMNPPLSYVAPANVSAVRVLAGITPVSRGGDSIGGSVAVETASAEFARPGEGVSVHGGVSAYHRTGGVVNGGYAWLSLAGENFRAGYSGSYVDADNYKDGAGRMVMSTFYEAQNHAVQLAARRGAHTLALDFAYQWIPQQGFANARMDMTGNESKSGVLRYTGAWNRLRLDARVYLENTRHSMNILRDKIPGMNMPMYTQGRNLGYGADAEWTASPRHTLRFGHEMRRNTLDDWWPPVMAMVGSMGPGTHISVNDGRRTRFGQYVEWEARPERRWTLLTGVRTDLVRMNTGDVVGYNNSPTASGSAAYYADAREFNALDRRRSDNNFDLTALARFEPGARSTFEFGYARKMRSPNLYERYLWVKRSFMSVAMSGWFGDGNGYAGNPDLRPETAHTVSASVAWRDAARKGWELKLTPYYTRVADFIDVDRCAVIADNSNGCTAARFAATSGFVTLRFANHDARLYGVDASWRAPLSGPTAAGVFRLRGLAGYVRGENLDTGDNLYQIMPAQGTVAVEHERGPWSSSFELQAVAAKRDVQRARVELPAAGYALLNVRTGYRWNVADKAGVRLDAGIDNLANRRYDLPLGGRYWVGDKTGATPVAGMGRSVFAGLTFQF